MAGPAPLRAGLAGLCPRCSARTLFDGPVAFAPACRMCGLDFQGFNVGDGPAAFLILIVGAIVVGFAITVELLFQPPFWVHALLWLPTAGLLTIFMLRVAKGALITLEYRGRTPAVPKDPLASLRPRDPGRE